MTTLDATREETVHAWPQWLPDGRSFIYLAVSRRPQQSGVYLARIGQSSRRLVFAGRYRAMYAEPGFLLHKENSRLVAQPFNPQDGTLHGTASDVASDVYSHEADGAVALDVSRLGVLSYTGRTRLPSRELLWVDRAGRRLATPGAADHYADFGLSPDGRFVALQRMMPEIEPPAPDLWALDLARSVRSRLTSQPGNDEGAAWAPDSRRFAYARHRGVGHPADLYLKDVREPDKDQPILVDDAGNKHPFDWSPDGRLLLYGLAQPNNPRQDIWVLPLAGDRAVSVAGDGVRRSGGAVSLDGRWVAYKSDETGSREIFVRAFASPQLGADLSGRSPGRSEALRRGVVLRRRRLSDDGRPRPRRPELRARRAACVVRASPPPAGAELADTVRGQPGRSAIPDRRRGRRRQWLANHGRPELDAARRSLTLTTYPRKAPRMAQSASPGRRITVTGSRALPPGRRTPDRGNFDESNTTGLCDARGGARGIVSLTARQAAAADPASNGARRAGRPGQRSGEVAGSRRGPACHVPPSRAECQGSGGRDRREAAADAEGRAGRMERHERPDAARNLHLLARRGRRHDERPGEPAGADVVRPVSEHVHGAGTPAWLPAPGVPRGAITRHTFHSAVANDDRDFFVYTPAGYDAHRARRIRCCICCTGWAMTPSDG